MSVRAFALMLAVVVSGNMAAASSDSDPAARAAEEHALHAQIVRMDDDLQALQSQLYALEHDGAADTAARDARRSDLRARIHRMDRDQELLENRLRELESRDPTASARPPSAAPPPPDAPPELPAPPASVASPAATAAPPLAIPASPARGPALRAAADPAPYEKAAGDRVPMFHYNPYRWVPVGTRQLAVYNSYDEAFLLDFDADCPGLLTTRRITVENFSTRVAVGKDAVIADGERCRIAAIRELQVSRLPP